MALRGCRGYTLHWLVLVGTRSLAKAAEYWRVPAPQVAHGERAARAEDTHSVGSMALKRWERRPTCRQGSFTGGGLI